MAEVINKRLVEKSNFRRNRMAAAFGPGGRRLGIAEVNAALRELEQLDPDAARITRSNLRRITGPDDRLAHIQDVIREHRRMNKARRVRGLSKPKPPKRPKASRSKDPEAWHKWNDAYEEYVSRLEEYEAELERERRGMNKANYQKPGGYATGRKPKKPRVSREKDPDAWEEYEIDLASWEEARHDYLAERRRRTGKADLRVGRRAPNYGELKELAAEIKRVDNRLYLKATRILSDDHASPRQIGNMIDQIHRAMSRHMDKSLVVEIDKRDDEQQLVFGWLYKSRDVNGRMIVDHSGEVIRPETLEKAAYDFVLESRVAGEMHKKIGVGRLVEAVVFTAEKRAAMGIPEGVVPDGLWVGFKIDDPDTWAAVKSGRYSMLSLGGKAQRRKYEDSDNDD